MLKLIKYEIIESYRQYAMTFAIFLILCFTSVLLPDFLKDFFTSLLIVAFFGINIAIIVNIVANFNRSMYKQPGYLTLTLPVTSNELIGAKLIGSMIWMFVGELILLVGFVILITLVGNIGFNNLYEVIECLFQEFFNHFGSSLLVVIRSVVLICGFVLSLFCIITITKTKYVPKYKAVVGLIIYIIGLVVFVNIMTCSLVDKFVVSLSSNGYEIFNIIIGLLLCGVFYILTVYLIDHRIEVE